MKKNLEKLQEKHIKNLEKIIDNERRSNLQLRKRTEDVELGSLVDKFKIPSLASMTQIDRPTPRIMKLWKKDTLRKSPMNLSSQHFFQQNATFSNFCIKQSELLDPKESNDKFSDVIKEIDRIENEPLPLTYENAIQKIKQKNGMLKFLTTKQPLLVNHFYQTSAEDQQEIDLLQKKVIDLQQQVQYENLKAQKYYDAYSDLQSQLKKFKKLNQQLEIESKNNLKQENQIWSTLINELRNLYDQEISRLTIENKSLSHLPQKQSQEFTNINS
eukprot:TRINITY_DN48268_c0_g1_i1.p1 TRINITY_DN48268_c0_g1~~TRINITY_DN48268_c0_g1_i1.p1  ORF type:complete len:272 (-),score=48.59 TRINITY_DN48268_c0_g1_i1:20-835(-)